VFAYFCIPETKGLPLEQIDLLYRESTIIGSNKYRAQMLAENETFTNHAGPLAGGVGAGEGADALPSKHAGSEGEFTEDKAAA
jgi:hypothetical protein